MGEEGKRCLSASQSQETVLATHSSCLRRWALKWRSLDQHRKAPARSLDLSPDILKCAAQSLTLTPVGNPTPDCMPFSSTSARVPSSMFSTISVMVIPGLIVLRAWARTCRWTSAARRISAYVVSGSACREASRAFISADDVR